jgi:predicted 2-oxoglutarate/Fe(II)-dependent dioxygenase YbiX
MDSVIQLTRQGLEADPADLLRRHDEFARQHWVRLPALLHPDVLRPVLDDLDRGDWAEVSEEFYTEAQPPDGPAVHLLRFLTNSPRFLEAAHAITGCGPFTWFDGRVYRMAAAGSHHDDWHSDFTGGRRVAMSLNLSRGGYDGGDLHIRAAGTQGAGTLVANRTLGDAVLFRLSEDWVHRVAPVTSGSRTAFAGWFNEREPSLIERLHQLTV